MSIGPTGDTVKEGLCGASIVQDDESGGVAGFFHLTNGKQSFSPILDDLINQGWAIVLTPFFFFFFSSCLTSMCNP